MRSYKLRDRKVWFTADWHLNHRLMIDEGIRDEFDSRAEMNDAIISNHNDLVGDTDVVVFLGDFALNSTNGEIDEFLDRCAGEWFFIIGNHDRRMHKFADRFTRFEDMMEILVWDPERYPHRKYHSFHCCHWSFRTWYKSHYGAYNLYAHSHGSLPEGDYLSMDVGIDTNNYRPYSYEDIMQKLSHKEFIPVDEHGK